MNIAYLQVRQWSLEGDNEVPVVGLYVYNEAKQCVVTLTRVEPPPPPLFQANSRRVDVSCQGHTFLSYIHTREPTNPRRMPTNFYGLVGYDRVKNYPLWFKSVSIPDQHPLYPRCIPDAPTPRSNPALPDLPPSFRLTSPRSVRPIPDLFLIQLRSLRSI